MKARHIIITGVAILLTPLLLAQEEILVDQLPSAARRTLDQASRNDPVKKVIRQVVDGRTIYLVELERDNAINPRLRIAETGELLPEPPVPANTPASAYALDPTAPAPVSYEPSVSLADLPKAVQQSIQNEAKGRAIADIDRETWNGRTVYEVEFRAKGLNPQVHVAEDGSIVGGEEARRGLKGLFLGTQLSDTPAPVQDTIRREAAGRSINDIDVERRTGKLVYEVEIRDPQTGTFELHVDANGQVLKDSRTGASQPKP